MSKKTPYKVKGIEIEDVKISPCGLDIEDELSKLLSEEIAKSLDKDILRGLGIEPDRNIRRRISIKKIFDLD